MAGRDLFAKDKGFFENAWEGAQRGLKQSGVGIIQAVNDATDGEVYSWLNEHLGGTQTPEQIDARVRQSVDDMNAEGKGTGVGGFVGETLTSPTTYLPVLGKGLAGLVASGVATGAAQGAVSPLGVGDSRADNVKTSAIVSGIASPIAGAIARPVENLNTDKEAQRLAKEISDTGIKLTAAQATGNKNLQGLEAVLGELPLTAGKVQKRAEDQLSKFTQAVLQKAGIASDSAAPDVLRAGEETLSKGFEEVAKRNTVAVDNILLNDLAAIEQEAAKRLGGKKAYKAVSSYIDDVLATGGSIPGDVYQMTRSKLGQDANTLSDRYVAGKLKDVQRALDDAMTRSVPPDDAKIWTDLRQKWANLRTIQRAMGSTSDVSVGGKVNPNALLNATKVGNRGYATGKGDLNTLARAGKLYLPEKVGNSGSAQRLLWQRLLHGGALGGAGGVAGAAYGYSQEGPAGVLEGAAKGAVLSTLGPKAFQSVVDTPVVQKYLTNGLPDAAGGALRSGAAGVGLDLQNAAQQYEGRDLFAPDAGADSVGGSAGNDTIPALDNPLPTDIRQNEGLRHTSYNDTTGHRTVGYGFNMDSGIAPKVWERAGIDVPFKDVYAGKAGISDAHAEALGRASYEIAANDAESLYGDLKDVSQSRREALLNLSYQLGKPALSGFRNFNTAVKQGKWTDAARHLLKSEYAKQTPERAREQARKLLRDA